MLLAVAGFLALTAVWAERGFADVVVSCGFEPAGDSWSYQTPVNDGGLINFSPGPDDFPANERILSGQGSWLVGDATSILTFSEVLLSGWKDVSVRYRVSSTAGASGGGSTPDDYVAGYVAATSYKDQSAPVFGASPDVAVYGRGSGTTWGYDSGAPPVIVNAGGHSVLSPAGSGLRTDDGYTDFAIRIPDGYRSLALKLYVTNIGPATFWNIDDVRLEAAHTVSRDRWWDGDGAGPVDGGSGDWNNPSAPGRWAADPSGGGFSAWDDANGDNAYFTAAGGVVTIASATTVAARSLTFAADGYKIARGDSKSRLALTDGGSGGAGANTIAVVSSDHTATIDVPVIGTPGVGLTKTGAGTLVLNRANYYTGPTAIDQGTLRVAAANRLGAAGTGVAFDGGTLQFSAAVDLGEEHPFTLLDGGGTIDTQNYTCSAATTGWSGSGKLTKRGSGTLALQGTNDAFAGVVYVQEGILQPRNSGVLDACHTIDLAAGAVLDLTAAEGFRLGAVGSQWLQGSGDVLGNLDIAPLGVHDLGHSPGIQLVEGDYAMNGTLRIEIAGTTPGAEAGYDQLRLSGDAHDVSLAGTLAVAWSGTGWASLGDELRIVRNDTAGRLAGTFLGLDDGALVGSYDGFEWRIYYAAGDGNDVLLRAAAPVPEPGSLCLLLLAGLLLLHPHIVSGGIRS